MQSRMDYLLFHRRSRPSGMLLAGQLGIQRIKLKKEAGTPLPPGTGIRTLLRWGSAMDLPSAFQAEFTLNSPRGICNATNKQLTISLLDQAGILVPTISRTASEVREFPVLGRSNTGSQGKDIVVYESSSEIPSNHSHDFFSSYIPNTREYRIHVVRGEIIRIQGKYCDFPEQTGNGFIKNHSHGYRFRTPDKELNNDRKEAAINAIESLGLDFGAVDLIVGTDRKPYVLEVNTAPAMSPMTMGVYVEAFRKILRENESRSKYPSTSVAPSKPRTVSSSRRTTPSTVIQRDTLRTARINYPAYTCQGCGAASYWQCTCRRPTISR